MSLSNLAWSRACAEILLKLGVQYICISPGSRNSPLTIGFTENKELNCFSFIDERSGGFFARLLLVSTNCVSSIIVSQLTWIQLSLSSWLFKSSSRQIRFPPHLGQLNQGQINDPRSLCQPSFFLDSRDLWKKHKKTQRNDYFYK